MSNIPFGNLPEVQQPWGFEGVKREQRGVYGDSRNFYVQPDHIEATDANSGEDPAHPLATIARAVVLARAYMGDVIYVMENDSWQYGNMTQLGVRESVTIPFDKPGLSIIGVGHGSMGVYWMPAADSTFALTINALDTVVEGFAFWGGNGIIANGSGIFLDWVGGAGGAKGENAVISKCTFETDLDMGIQMEFSWYNEIFDCHFKGCNTFGIYVAPPPAGGIESARIINNYFDDCAVAMALNGADNCLIKGNHVFNAAAQGGAAATDQGLFTTAGSENLVEDNYFSCQLPVGVGDYNDLNTAAATDAWINNHCMNGDAVTNPT